MSRVKVVARLMVVAILAFALTSCSGSKEKTDLKLHLQKNQTYRLNVTADQKISQTIRGNTQDIIQIIGIHYQFDVTDVDSAGVATANVTYKALRFKQEGPRGTFEYDSSNPPEELQPMAKGLDVVVGEWFQTKISPDGKVVEVAGLDSMFKRISAKLDVPDPRMKTALERNIKFQFGEKNFRETVENALAIFPETSVAPGDTWEREVPYNQVFPMMLNNSWTLNSRKNGVVYLTFASQANPESDSPPVKMGPMNISYKISGTQNGTIELYEESGWVKKSVITQKFEGQAVMDPNPQMPQGMSWPITLEGTITVASGETE